MKPYKRFGKVKDGSKTLHYQFIIGIKLIPRIYQLECDKMSRLLKEKCLELGLNYLDLSVYQSLEEDRRSNKTIPRGYRLFRFSYAERRNITWTPYVKEKNFSSNSK